jgi:hypothetical protein
MIHHWFLTCMAVWLLIGTFNLIYGITAFPQAMRELGLEEKFGKVGAWVLMVLASYLDLGGFLRGLVVVVLKSVRRCVFVGNEVDKGGKS